jgi:hypothetical protein
VKKEADDCQRVSVPVVWMCKADRIVRVVFTVYQPQQQYVPQYQPEQQPMQQQYPSSPVDPNATGQAYAPGQQQVPGAIYVIPPSPISPVDSAAAPIAPMQMSSSGSPKHSMSSSSDDRAGKDPKLCFCIEPDTNLTEEQRAKKYKCFIPQAVIGGIAALVLLILAIIALRKIADFTGAYSDILSTWKSQPIYDVKFINIANACPANYDVNAAEWGGTKPACACPAAHAGNSTDSTACTAGLLASPYNCVDRKAIPAVDLHLGQTLKMCVQRAGVNALARTAANSDGTCPSGTILCSGDGVGAFCEPNNVMVNGAPRCPLTDFYIGSIDIVVGFQIEKTPLGVVDGTPLFLYVTRSGTLPSSVTSLAARSPGSLPVTALPLTDINLVSGEPCLITTTCYYSGRSAEYTAQVAAAKASTNGLGYTLVDGTTGCTGCRDPPAVPGGSVSPDGLDIRYVKGFTRSEASVFTESGVPAVFTTTNPKYQLTVQARSEIIWTNTCAEDKAAIVSQENFVRHIRNFQITLLVIAVLSFIIFSIAIPVTDWKTKGHWTDNRTVWYVKTIVLVLFKAFVIAFTVATMILALGVLSYWSQVDGSTPAHTCSDPLSTEVFKILTSDYRSLSYSNVGSSVSMGASGIMDAVSHFIWSCSK